MPKQPKSQITQEDSIKLSELMRQIQSSLIETSRLVGVLADKLDRMERYY